MSKEIVEEQVIDVNNNSCDESIIEASDSCLQEDEINTLDSFIACLDGIGSNSAASGTTPSIFDAEETSTSASSSGNASQLKQQRSTSEKREDEKISAIAAGNRRNTNANNDSTTTTTTIDDAELNVACKTTEQVLQSMVNSGYDMMSMCTGTQLQDNDSKQKSQTNDDDDKYCAICLTVPTLPQPATAPHAIDQDSNAGISTTTVCPIDGFAHLPCCGGKDGMTELTTSTKICTKCLLILCTPTSDGQASIGRCPRCRSWISISPSSSSSQEFVTITKSSHAGQCKICYQIKAVLLAVDGTNNNSENSNNNLCCDACYLGVRNPLLYKCQTCSQVQRIPHPMYRYQTDGPTQYTHDTWACQRCGTFTKWKILPSQIHLIPPGDVPESWGEEYNSMALARARVQQQRQQERGADTDTHPMYHGWPPSCSIS